MSKKTNPPSSSSSVLPVGLMKGTVKNLTTGSTLDFHTTEVFRVDSDGDLHVWANMAVGQTSKTISFILRGKDIESGHYPVLPVEHSKVRSLIYHESSPAIGYEARNGYVDLLNFHTVGQIEGGVAFATAERAGKHFEVKVDFNIRGFGQENASTQ